MVGLGVADGVYMWKTQGIDAGLFSRTLMTAARSEVEGGNGDALAGARCGSWIWCVFHEQHSAVQGRTVPRGVCWAMLMCAHVRLPGRVLQSIRG